MYFFILFLFIFGESTKMMVGDVKFSSGNFVFCAICLLLALIINNVIPFLSLPTMGQALWAMGYAKSLSNEGFFNLYAYDIGFPHPAAIAFGLSAVLPLSWLIKFGVLPEAAYSLVFALYIGLAFFGCYKISRLFHASQNIASIFSLLWLITPVIGRHSGYSMLMLGIALIPFYCWITYVFFQASEYDFRQLSLKFLVFLSSVIISVFMDGYTFIMFAVAASAIALFSFLQSADKKSFFLKKLIGYSVAFCCAYLLYSCFIGKSSYQPESLDFFRGWGLDLSFLFIPTQGVFWFYDLLALSKHRTASHFFGDASVWNTSFILPFLLLGVIGWYQNKRKSIWFYCVFILGVFSVYMALGPSIKFFSFKPDDYMAPSDMANTMLMPEKYALGPTGNSFISQYLPGFNVMRASYRWIALASFCFWVLTLSMLVRVSKKRQYIFSILLVALFLPHLSKAWNYGRANFLSVADINKKMVDNLKIDIDRSSRVAFIPWNNDFFANYLAPYSNFKTFNIGGDKNLDVAKLHWPPVMLNLQGAVSDAQIPYITQLLLNKNVDYIIIPFVNMLWSAHYWECPEDTLLPLSSEKRISLKNDLDFKCPAVIKKNYSSLLYKLDEIPFFNVKERDYYAVISLDEKKYTEYLNSENIHYPFVINDTDFNLDFVLDDGWYYREPGHVWSKDKAVLQLPVPNDSSNFFVLKYNVLLSKVRNSVDIEFKTSQNNQIVTEEVTSKTNDASIVLIPIDHSQKVQKIELFVKDAKSPAELGLGTDNRMLGLSLQEVSIKH